MYISAVVVTYNRLKLLKECLNAILKQSHQVNEIIIVDNASTDGTKKYLEFLSKKEKQINYVRLQTNTGCSGGVFEGIKIAYQNNSDWIWLMDDDTVPRKDALERLVESEIFKNLSRYWKKFALEKPVQKEIGLLASRVDWIDGTRCEMNIPFLHLRWNRYNVDIPGCFQLRHASFVSILINRKVVEKVGFPIKEFFIWYDDWEYTGRITQKFPAFYAEDSVVIHKTPRNENASDLNLRLENLWKYQYGFRNQITHLVYGSDRLGFFRGLTFLLGRIRNLIQLKKSFKIVIGIFFWGFKGFFFDYKKKIVFPEK